MEVLLANFPHCGGFLLHVPHCGSFIGIHSTLWKFSYQTFRIVEVLLAYFPHCGSFLIKLSTLWKFFQYHIMLFTFWRISQSSEHFFHKIVLPIQLWQSTLLIIQDISSTFFIWTFRFTRTSTNPSTIRQNSSAKMLAALAQYSISEPLTIS